MRSQLITYIWDKKKDHNTLVIDNIFSFQVIIDIIRNDENLEPKIMNECQYRYYWPNGNKQSKQS